MLKNSVLAVLSLAGILACADNLDLDKLSNLPSMPVIDDAHYYDNPVRYVDRNAGHPLAERLTPLVSGAVAGGVPGFILLADTPRSGAWVAAAGDIDLKNKIPMKKNSLVRIGSVTKMFTAVVIMQLRQEGKLSLDDPVGAYLPAETIRSIENADRATIRQLLSHTSGIANYSDYFDVPLFLRTKSNLDLTTLQALDLARGRKADFAPGAGGAYSNTGYILLGLIAEKITGAPIGEAYRARIFRPLGLAGTYYDPDRPVHRETARGYVEYEGRVIDVTDCDQARRTPDGGIVSTVFDLAVFIQALVRDHTLLPEAVFREMTDNAVFVRETGCYHGLGIMCSVTHQGEPIYGHSGGHLGYGADLWYLPESGTTIAALNNGSRFFGRSRETLRTFLGKTVSVATAGEPGVVALRKTKEATIASLRKTIADYAEQDGMWKTLEERSGKRGLGLRFPAYTVYHGSDKRGHDVEVVWTVAAPDAAAPDAAAPDAAADGIVIREEPGCETAAIVSPGPDARRPADYDRLDRWIDGHGFRRAGPPREYYLLGRWNENDPEAWLTEIRLPVAKK